jgi:hypothetical protein
MAACFQQEHFGAFHTERIRRLTTGSPRTHDDDVVILTDGRCSYERHSFHTLGRPPVCHRSVSHMSEHPQGRTCAPRETAWPIAFPLTASPVTGLVVPQSQSCGRKFARRRRWREERRDPAGGRPILTVGLLLSWEHLSGKGALLEQRPPAPPPSDRIAPASRPGRSPSAEERSARSLSCFP